MRERQPSCLSACGPSQLLAFLGGDQPHLHPHLDLAACVAAADGRFARRSRASDQLANEPFRYTTAPQSHASLLRSDMKEPGNRPRSGRKMRFYYLLVCKSAKIGENQVKELWQAENPGFLNGG